MYLMSKNIPVAQIDFSKMIFNILKPNLMPFALRGEGVDLFTLRDWINDRVLSLSRSNAKKILDSIGLDQNNRVSICFACKGLSLSDCYWFKTEESKETWDDVNLYSNSLTSAVASVALRGIYVSIQGKICTPELTGLGSYAKCWRRRNGKLYSRELCPLRRKPTGLPVGDHN